MSKIKLVAVISLVTILILSIGFFIGFSSYIPISRVRSRAASVQRQRTETSRQSEILNKAAPEIVSETLEGEKWHLANQKGKVVVVIFWSVFCSICIDEIPVMNALQSQYGAREDFLLVGVHRFGERDIISCYRSAKSISWTQLYEKGDSLQTGFTNTLGFRRTPTICLIDREGIVRAVHSDVSIVEKEVRDLMEAH